MRVQPDTHSDLQAMTSRTMSMLLVQSSDDSVRVECGRCEAQHVLTSAAYCASMQNGRHFQCPVCMQLGRLPDRRHHAASVKLERRRSIQPPWAWPTAIRQA
jgi:late competence protein required for DNA uptake (superfamily II DNA/RNA helicase)